MKLRSLSALAATLALALPMLARADQVITFEGYPSGTVFTNQFPGVSFSNATILTLGVSLNPVFPPHSGVNVVYNADGGPMTLLFSTPVQYFEGYFTYNQPLVIDAFNSSNTLLSVYNSVCTANYIGAGTSCLPNEFGIVNGLNISRVTIAGGGGDNFVLDDAEFSGSVNSTSPAPEPNTMVMVGTGLLGLAGAVRRKLFA